MAAKGTDTSSTPTPPRHSLSWLDRVRTSVEGALDRTRTHARTGATAATPSGPATTSPVLGPNVLFFSPKMETSAMQKQLDDLYAMQKSSEFGPARWAVFFAPGEYTLDVKVGYYTTVHGLGASPRNTTITGAVRSKAALAENNATTTFWRGVENLTVVPTVAEDGKKLTWATSQGTWLRRINVQGNVNLHDHNGWCSGGYISDSAVSGQIDSGSQQQYFIRNTSMGEFLGGAYAQVFVGCTGAPAEDWPAKPYSNTEQTPVVREKPYFIQDVNNGGDGDGDDGDDGGDDSKTRSDSHDAPAVAIVLPAARTDSQGPSWLDGDDGNEGDAVSTLSTWHVVTPDTFDVDAANKALATSQNVLFTPGVYNLSSSLQITQPDTTILGMGLATLKPLNGTPAITVADVDGATVAGVLLDAGENHSSSLLRVGDAKSFHRHDADPIVLNDVFFRVGGASPAPSHVDTMCVVNLRDTVIDHIWAWRGDHESGVGWNLNRCNVGLRVEADDVVAYALFVEHCNEYQTMWNGNKGRVFFYQVIRRPARGKHKEASPCPTLNLSSPLFAPAVGTPLRPARHAPMVPLGHARLRVLQGRAERALPLRDGLRHLLRVSVGAHCRLHGHRAARRRR